MNQYLSSKNWFEQDGAAYAQFRPQYPIELASYLASLVLEPQLAVDVGCGSGQLTRLLSPHFQQVIGIDPSQEQLSHAVKLNNITYLCSSAETVPIADRSVNLITAAQAAHWFDLPKFYQTVNRIGCEDVILALISYGVLELDTDLNERFQHFYWHEIGQYWPAERKLVDSGYQTIPFPFAEFTAPALAIELNWDLAAFLGYLSTWSAVRHAQKQGQQVILERFAQDIQLLWGDSTVARSMRWNINMRIGRKRG